MSDNSSNNNTLERRKRFVGGQEGAAFNHPELFPGYPDSLRMHNDLAEFVSFFQIFTYRTQKFL